MTFLKSINLGIRFLLEIFAIATISYIGFKIGKNLIMKYFGGVGIPFLIIFIWGTFGAPRSPMQLSEPYLFLLEFAIYGLSSLGLFLVGHPLVASSLIITFFLNRGLMFIWGQ